MTDRPHGARPETLSAVTLKVSDMGRSMAFYESLGFERIYGDAGAGFTSYRVGAGSYLNLQVAPDWHPGAASWGRVIVWVSDVDAMFATARAAGIKTLTEPADASWGERYFHLLDPDGHELSFARPL